MTKIKLIREDFDSLVPNSPEFDEQYMNPWDCPIARALRREFPNEEKVGVNWRKEYNVDNIFNITMFILSLMVLVLFELKKISVTELKITLGIIIVIGLFININARGFFNTKKYN